MSLTTWRFAVVVFAALAYAGAAFSQTSCRTSNDIMQGTQPAGGSTRVCRVVTLQGWRAFKGGVQWRSQMGPWTQQNFGWYAIGLYEGTRTGADYVLFDWAPSSGLGTRCIPLNGSCP
jgi:hypothetical protein